MAKILDPTKREFYFYENTKQFTFSDLQRILNKTKAVYNKALAFHKRQKIKSPFIPSVNQWNAIQRLTNPKYNDIKFVALGGGVNGGKSFGGAYWVITKSMQNAGSFYLVGRRFQNVIANTTLKTFYKALKELGVPNSEWKYNQQTHIMKFNNGSQIIFQGMDFMSSEDPSLNSLRGMELTGAFLDESNELMDWSVKELKNRIGRNNSFKNKIDDKYIIKPIGKIKVKEKESKDEEDIYIDEAGHWFKDKDAETYIEPYKILFTFNPDRNWIYDEFYRPWKSGILDRHTYYQPSLAITNPFATSEGLKITWDNGEIQRQKYLLGNFDYDDSENSLLTHTQIKAIFDNITSDVSKKFLTVDVSGESGSDNTVFTLWRGWEVFKVMVDNSMSQDEIVNQIIDFCSEFEIPFKNVAVDAIGIGEGVARDQRIAGVFIYKSSNKPLPQSKTQVAKENDKGIIEMSEKFGAGQYNNLRSQTAWVLANKIISHEVSIRCDTSVRIKAGDKDWSLREVFERELAVLKDKNFGKDEMKRQLISKLDMKKILSNSPDILDTMIMRGVFDLIENYDIIKQSNPISDKFRELLSRKNFKQKNPYRHL